jgi:uncharacterized membrane protein YebE (DUF533 family)
MLTFLRNNKMRKLGLSILVLAGLLLAGSLSYAAETVSSECTVKKTNSEKKQADRTAHMEQMKERHQKMMAELKDLRATAESEGATKTVAKIDVIINKMEENAQKMQEFAGGMKKAADCNVPGKGKCCSVKADGKGKCQKKQVCDVNEQAK